MFYLNKMLNITVLRIEFSQHAQRCFVFSFTYFESRPRKNLDKGDLENP